MAETQIKACFKYVRISPRKVKPVLELARGKQIQTALDNLKFCRRRAARPILKLIRSALANASQKGGLDLDNLHITKLTVDQGPSLKRWRPRSRGMAHPILKRTSHLSVVLEEK